jgi:hypothetical protein
LSSFDVWLNFGFQIPYEYPVLSVTITKGKTKEMLLLYSEYFMEKKQDNMFSKFFFYVQLIDFCKTTATLHYVSEFSSCLTQNAVCILYENQQVNAV